MSTLDNLPDFDGESRHAEDGATAVAPPGDDLLELLRGRQAAAAPAAPPAAAPEDFDESVAAMHAGRRRGLLVAGIAAIAFCALLAWLALS